MALEQWPPDADRLAQMWVGGGADVWPLLADLDGGVKFEFGQRSNCIIGNCFFPLYPGCPVNKNGVESNRLARLAERLILTAPVAQALAETQCASKGLPKLAMNALTRHTSIPPVFSLAAACCRPDLIVIAYGIWHEIRGCAGARALEEAMDTAITEQWVCDPYGEFLPYILHLCYSIGTGFTDTYNAKTSDVKVEGSIVGYIAAPRDKAMLALLCGKSRHIPADTPPALRAVWSILQNYI